MKYPILARAFFLYVVTFGIAYANEPVPSPEYEDRQFVIDERAAIKRASAAWVHFLNNKDVIKTGSLYANQIFVYATFEPKINNYSDLIRYFTKLTQKENFKVKFNEENIRVYGPTAVNSGLYTFSFTEKGELKKIAARFTFVYTLTPSGWKIVDHHSSVLPE